MYAGWLHTAAMAGFWQNLAIWCEMGAVYIGKYARDRIYECAEMSRALHHPRGHHHLSHTCKKVRHARARERAKAVVRLPDKRRVPIQLKH